MTLSRTTYALTSAGLTAAALMTTPLAALAAWDATAPDTATAARAMVLPTGPIPSSVAHASTVTVDWTAAGVPVRGYRVVRTNLTTGETVPAGSGCAGLRSKTECREVTVPDGIWAYGVTTVVGTQWTSAPGFSAPTAITTAQRPEAPAPDADDEPPPIPVAAPIATPVITPSQTPHPPTPRTATPSPTPDTASPTKAPDHASPTTAPDTATPSPKPEVATPSTTSPTATPTATAHPAESAEPTPTTTHSVQGR